MTSPEPTEPSGPFADPPTTDQQPATAVYVDRHNCTPFLPPAVDGKQTLACGQTLTCSACGRVFETQVKIEFGGEPQPQLVCVAEPPQAPTLPAATTTESDGAPT